jgi:hypothetical protein
MAIADIIDEANEGSALRIGHGYPYTPVYASAMESRLGLHTRQLLR